MKKEIVFVSCNSDGNFYVGYKIKVQRGIRGKSKSKVDELIIVGIPRDKFNKWCLLEGLKVVVRDNESGDEYVYGD